MKNDRRLWLKAIAVAPMIAALPARADERVDALAVIRQHGRLRIAVYNNFPPYSMSGGKGIDAEIGRAIAEKLGFFNGFFCPNSGFEIGCLFIQQIEWNHTELHAGSSAKKQYLIAFGNVEHFLEQCNSFIQYCLEFFAAVRYFEQRHTYAIQIKNSLSCVFNSNSWKN